MNRKLVVAIFLFFLMEARAGAAASDEWTWEISVIPPDSGWESIEGSSIKATLGWFEKEINQNPTGLLEHDIRFVYSGVITETNISSESELLKASKSVAILNFASDEINRSFVPLLGRGGKPMLLAYGEDIWLYDGMLPYPYVFALDFYRDYRTRALVDYAVKVFNPSVTNRISMIVSRFSLNEEREAKLCERFLSGLDIESLIFWTDASNFNTFRLLEEEIKASMTGVLFCYVGSMATREIWRGVRGLDSQYQLWYPGTPNDSFLSYNGIVFADQTMKLPEEGGFIAIKRKLWGTRAVDVKDEVTAGRAYALASWLIDSIRKAKRAEPDILIYSLASAAEVPFGNQKLDISPDTHRPLVRDIYIMRIMDKKYDLIEILKVNGLNIAE